MLLSQSNDDVLMIVKTMHEVFEKDTSQTMATNVQFKFTNEDYRRLELATLICGSFSIFASVGVLAMYIHLSIYYPRDANRVSLHCVTFSILLSLVDDCLNVAALKYELYNSFCSTFRTVDGIITLISSCLLAMVGVHLLLIFYFHVRHWPCRPEYIFFPISICYGFIGNIRNYISNDTPPNFRTIYIRIPHVCWYYSNYIDRIYNYSAWIYYYSFLFLIIVVSFFCSLVAMRTVFLDNKENQDRLVKIATRASSVPESSSLLTHDQTTASENELTRSPIQNTLARTMKKNRDSFSTIVFRSLLYPLISSIWGFGLQMYLVDDSHFASLGIAITIVVMSRLEGLFIACIFFMDPSVQKAQRTLWKRVWSCFFKRPETRPVATSTTIVAPTAVSEDPRSSEPSVSVADTILSPAIPNLEPQ